jgi:hypothetical protein
MVECKTLLADVPSSEEAQVTESLSICKTSHIVVDVTQDPGTIDLGRLVSANSPRISLEDFVLVAAMQGLRNECNPELLHEIGYKLHALDQIRTLLLRSRLGVFCPVFFPWTCWLRACPRAGGVEVGRIHLVLLDNSHIIPWSRFGGTVAIGFVRQ